MSTNEKSTADGLDIDIDLGGIFERKIGLTGRGEEIGVRGIGKTSHGVEGITASTTGGVGVHGVNAGSGAGVLGESATWVGVHGKSEAADGGHGVLGEAVGTGVSGISRTWVGVYGESNGAPGSGTAGLWGDGKDNAFGVKGHARAEGVPGIAGYQLADKGPGLYGEGATGVNGVGHTWVGVYGETHGDKASGPSGVLGEGLETGIGVKGHARAEGMAAVAAYHLTHKGPGIYAEGAPAGFFNGDVHVTGDLQLLGADLAEQFDVVEESVAAGTVVVLDDAGAVEPCGKEYDSRVAGVISGAGDRKPGLVLDRQDTGATRQPVAMAGKAWCQADATTTSIEVGSLLTTSAVAGHAMRATDRNASFGAILGKALTPLASGTGLVLVLVGLG